MVNEQQTSTPPAELTDTEHGEIYEKLKLNDKYEQKFLERPYDISTGAKWDHFDQLLNSNEAEAAILTIQKIFTKMQQRK